MARIAAKSIQFATKFESGCGFRCSCESEGNVTKAELLKATGNIWRVVCWHDGNRRRIVQTLYIRASDVLAAEEVGRRESGRRCVDAAPWNPKTDRRVFGYVQEVASVGN